MRLGMKRVLWGAALAAAACMFFACGEGSIDGFNGDDDMALLNYGQFNPDGMKGLVNTAMAQCEEDPLCKEAMEKAKDVPPPADSTASSSSVTVDTTSTGSSSSTTPTSSPASGSSSSATPASSSATNTSSSSAAPRKDVVATKFVGTCSATSVVKGNPTTWKFIPTKTCITADFCSLDPESYEWTFTDGDKTTSTDAEPSVVYASKGSYTASVKLTNGDVVQTITCTPVSITGPEVTGCTCGEPTYNPSSKQLKDGSPVKATWVVSGCTSIDGKGNEETSFTYSWSGESVSGNTETGTGSYTKKGIYEASVTVTNSDGNSKVVTCEKALVDWTFKCSPLNSTLLETEQGTTNNKTQFNAVANECYSYPMSQSTISYDASIQAADWNGSTTMHYIDCKGNEGNAYIQNANGNNNFTEIGMNYEHQKECTIYFYLEDSLDDFQIQMW